MYLQKWITFAPLTDADSQTGKQYTQWIDKNRSGTESRRGWGGIWEFDSWHQQRKEKWKMKEYNLLSHLMAKHRNDCLHSMCAHMHVAVRLFCVFFNPEPISIEMYTHMCESVDPYVVHFTYTFRRTKKESTTTKYWRRLYWTKQSWTKTWKKTKENITKQNEKFATVVTSAESIDISESKRATEDCSHHKPTNQLTKIISSSTQLICRFPRVYAQTDDFQTSVKFFHSFRFDSLALQQRINNLSLSVSLSIPLLWYTSTQPHSNIALLIRTARISDYTKRRFNFNE